MNSHNHAIRGIILKDNTIYVPLDELVKFCRRFPTVPSQQISDVIEKSITDLLSDPVRLEAVPKVILNITTK